MFNFVKEPFEITHLNLRTELHGDESVKAVDIKFEYDMHNSVLDKFSEGLKDALYTTDDGAITDMLNPEHAPHLRHPIFEAAFKLGNKLESAKLDIQDDYQLGTLIFREAKAGNIKILCKEGGSVHVSWTLSISDPSPNDQAKLFVLLNEIVKVDLEAEAKPESSESIDDVVDAEFIPPLEDSNVHPLFNPKAASMAPSDIDDEPTAEELEADEVARKKAMSGGMNVE